MIDFTLFLKWTLTISICPLENKIIDSPLTLNIILNYNKNIKTLILNLTTLYNRVGALAQLAKSSLLQVVGHGF
jgi:hypothetical protein